MISGLRSPVPTQRRDLARWFGAVPLAVLVAVRATLEEHTLLRELAGYDDYVRRVRHRLIPFVW